MTVRNLQLAIVDFAMTAIGLAALAFGIYYIFAREVALSMTALGSGLVLLFAATIDRFESVKGLGMEAKTRKLETAINKAEVTLSQLKDLVEVMGASLVKLSSNMGQWEAKPSVMDAYHSSRQVKRLFQGVGSSEAFVRDALLPWAKTAAEDLVRWKAEHLHADLMELVPQLLVPRSTAQPNAPSAVAVQGYTGLALKDMRAWTLEEFPRRLADLLAKAPALKEQRRQELKPAFDAAIAQLNFLAEKLDFDDVPLWASIRHPA